MRRLCESYLSGNIQITLSSELIRIPRHRRLGLDAFRTPGRRGEPGQRRRNAPLSN